MSVKSCILLRTFQIGASSPFTDNESVTEKLSQLLKVTELFGGAIIQSQKLGSYSFSDTAKAQGAGGD